MKIRPVGAALFRAGKQTDGQTDMMRLIVAFGNFANAPKNGIGHSGRSSVSFTSPSHIRRNIKGTDDIIQLT